MKKIWLAILLLIPALGGRAQADCPGCALGVLVPPAELLILDLPSTVLVFGGGRLMDQQGRFGPTFKDGLWGGSLGFLAGSLIAYPFVKDGFHSIVYGGLMFGMPVGVLGGNLWGFLGSRPKQQAKKEGLPPLYLTVLPSPKETRIALQMRF